METVEGFPLQTFWRSAAVCWAQLLSACVDFNASWQWSIVFNDATFPSHSPISKSLSYVSLEPSRVAKKSSSSINYLQPPMVQEVVWRNCFDKCRSVGEVTRRKFYISFLFFCCIQLFFFGQHRWNKSTSSSSTTTLGNIFKDKKFILTSVVVEYSTTKTYTGIKICKTQTKDSNELSPFRSIHYFIPSDPYLIEGGIPV